MEAYKRMHKKAQDHREGIKEFNEEQEKNKAKMLPLLGGDDEDYDIDEVQKQIAENDTERKREQIRIQDVIAEQQKHQKSCQLRGYADENCMPPASRTRITNCAIAMRRANTYPNYVGTKEYREQACKNIENDPYVQRVDPSKQLEEFARPPQLHPMMAQSGKSVPKWNTKPGHCKTESGGIFYCPPDRDAPTSQSARPGHYLLRNAFF
jgi:hypothetical protein